MKKTITMLIDDLDGSGPAETVRFSLDGVDYEIDLNTMHAYELREALLKYAEAGRKFHRVAQRRVPATARPGPGNWGRLGRQRAAKIRAWAKENGIEVNQFGRIPMSVVGAYEIHTGDD